MGWKLKDADRTTRAFLTAFLLVVTAGYTVGLAFVDHTTSGTPSGISGEFRGNEDSSVVAQSAGEIKFEKSPREIYTFLHNHVFSLSMLFFCVGAVFSFSSVPPGLRMFLLVEPFAAIVTTFGGIWLLRFVDPAFAWLVIVSSLSMIGSYLAMVAFILKELWFRR